MKILGLESSGKIAGAAIVEDGVVLAEYTLNAGITHSQTFLPMLDSMLKQSKISLEEIDYIAISQGPGSYTGLRIGISTAKGFALASNIKVIPVSTLEGLAQNIADFEGKIFSLLFARSNELYFAVYQSVDGELKEVVASTVLLLPEVIEKMKQSQEQGEKIAVIGDGFFHFETEIRNAVCGNLLFVPARHRHQLSATGIALLGEKKTDCSISGFELVPVYLKKTQAEREIGE